MKSVDEGSSKINIVALLNRMYPDTENDINSSLPAKVLMEHKSMLRKYVSSIERKGPQSLGPLKKTYKWNMLQGLADIYVRVCARMIHRMDEMSILFPPCISNETKQLLQDNLSRKYYFFTKEETDDFTLLERYILTSKANERLEASNPDIGFVRGDCKV